MGMNKNQVVTALVVAAGSGTRMKLSGDVNKVFLELDSSPVLAHTLEVFERCKLIDKIVIVTRECDIPLCIQLAHEYNISKLLCVVRGGDTRTDSVKNGLMQIEDKESYVAIHDGARCLVTHEELENVILAAYEYGASALAVACKDSLKRVTDDGFIESSVSRENVYRVQTPQVFRVSDIIYAHEKAEKDGIVLTDDCGAAQYAGIKVKIVDGSETNIKLTVQDDIVLAKAIINQRSL